MGGREGGGGGESKEGVKVRCWSEVWEGGRWGQCQCKWEYVGVLALGGMGDRGCVGVRCGREGVWECGSVGVSEECCCMQMFYLEVSTEMRVVRALHLPPEREIATGCRFTIFSLFISTSFSTFPFNILSLFL